MTAIENLIKARLAASPQVIVETKSHNELYKRFGYFCHQNRALKLNKKYLESYKFFKNNFSVVRYRPDSKKIHLATIKKHLRVINDLRNETYGLVFRSNSLS